MKKTLLAAALLGSFAASAFAAPSVTLYGIILSSLLNVSSTGTPFFSNPLIF